MQTKNSFYDFVGYIIPGAVVLVLIYWFSTSFFAMTLLIDIKNLGESILFLVASYLLGHMVQSLGKRIEKRQKEKWGGWFSEQFLRADNDHYSPEFKSALFECTEKIFGLSFNKVLVDETAMRRRQEIFNLCYALVVQEDAAQHTEIFNGIYSLYRGMLASVWIGVVVSVLITLKHFLGLIFLLSDHPWSQDPFWQFVDFHLGLGIVSFIFLSVIIPGLTSRFERFAIYFVDSVYRNFYVWCKIHDENH